MDAPGNFPAQVVQTSILQGTDRGYARRTLRQTRYGVRLPDGLWEPAVSAHHVSAIVEAHGGEGARFSGTDVGNYMAGRWSQSLLSRLPDDMVVTSYQASAKTFTRPQIKQRLASSTATPPLWVTDTDSHLTSSPDEDRTCEVPATEPCPPPTEPSPTTTTAVLSSAATA